MDAVTKLCYIIRLEDIQDYIKKHSYLEKVSCDYDDKERVYKRSKGALINIDTMLLLYDIKIIDLGA